MSPGVPTPVPPGERLGLRREGSMDLHDTPDAANDTQVGVPGSYHPPITSNPLLMGERASSPAYPLPEWHRQLAKAARWSMSQNYHFPDQSCTRNTKRSLKPAAPCAAGTASSSLLLQPAAPPEEQAKGDLMRRTWSRRRQRSLRKEGRSKINRWN